MLIHLFEYVMKIQVHTYIMCDLCYLFLCETMVWMKKITARLVAGQASPDDLDTLESVAYQIDGRTICAFGEACAWPVESMLDKFRDELLAETVEGNAQSALNAEQEAQRRYLKDAVACADKP